MNSGPSPYASSVRPEIHDMIPPGTVRLLDVGCNDGRFGQWAKASRRVASVTGIEPHLGQAELARGRLDAVVAGSYPGALDKIEGKFDCITFNHVLEHLLDPWAALKVTSSILRHPGGRVVALIPNVRYISLVYNLFVRGQWTYTDKGLLDRTHLRFFTRDSATEMFHQAGYDVICVKPVNAVGNVRAPRLSWILTRVVGDLAYGGFVFVAAPSVDRQMPLVR